MPPWNGTPDQMVALRLCYAASCANCTEWTPCGRHRGDFDNQRLLDGLLFGQAVASVFVKEEWEVDHERSTDRSDAAAGEPLAG